MTKDHIITANELEILIRHYINTHVDMDHVGQSNLDKLVELKLLDKLDIVSQPYIITERGICYIRHLLKILLPIKKWVENR